MAWLLASLLAALAAAVPPRGGGGGGGGVGQQLLLTWYSDAAAHLPLRADCGDRSGPGPLNSSRAPASAGPRAAWAPAAFFELPRRVLLIAGLRPHTQATGHMQPDVLRSADGGRSWSCVGTDYSWGTARAGAVSFTVTRSVPSTDAGGGPVAAAACIAGGRPLRFATGPDLPAAACDRERAYSSGGGMYDAPVRDVRCTVDGAVWRAAASLPSAVVGATHVRIVPPTAPAANSSSGGSDGGGGGGGGYDGEQPPPFFDVLLGGWREDGGGQELWVAEYPPEAAFNASDPLAFALPTGWRQVRLPQAGLKRTATVATWLAATQLLLLGGGEIPVDSLAAGPNRQSGALARRLAVDANTTAQSSFARPLPVDEADLTTGTTREAVPLRDLVLVADLLPLLLAPWQPAIEQQPDTAARITRLALQLPESRPSGMPRTYSLYSDAVPQGSITVVRVFFQSESSVFATFVSGELDFPARPEFLEWRHVQPTWPQTRAPEVTAPVNTLGAANWDRPARQQVPDAFDYILGASDADGGLLRGSTARCELNASCVEGHQFSSGCRESPWDAQCTPCTRCTPGVSYASTLCVLRGDAVCAACPACKPGFAVAIACGMPGNPSGALHVCAPAGAAGQQPILGARELSVVGVVLGVEAALALLAVAVVAAAAACGAHPTADPRAAAARAARLIASTAWGLLTTTLVVTVTLALVGLARAEELNAVAIASLTALCVGPVATTAALALPDAWACAVFGCGPSLLLREAVSAAFLQRPLEVAWLLLALPWRPQLLLGLAPFDAAREGGQSDAEWGSLKRRAAPAAHPGSSTPGGGPHGGAATASSASVAAPAWSPQQAAALRALTLSVALLGDLPLAITSIVWVLALRGSDSRRVLAHLALPALLFVLCFWHMCSALMAVVASAARGPGQVAAAKLFKEAASSPPTGGGDVAHVADEAASSARGGRSPQRRRGRLEAAAPSDGSSALKEAQQQQLAPSGASADGLDAPRGLEAASAPPSLRSSGPAPVDVVVGNPLQLSPSPQPPHAGRQQQQQQQQQQQHGSALAPSAAVAVVSNSTSRGGTCPLIQAAVESLCRELGVPPPASSSLIGFDNVQRIGELWACAATPEARRLAHMTTFWSTHPALLPAALDGVLQSPLPPAWLQLLRLLEGAAQQRRRVRSRSSNDSDSEVTASGSHSTTTSPTSSAAQSPAGQELR